MINENKSTCEAGNFMYSQECEIEPFFPNCLNILIIIGFKTP